MFQCATDSVTILLQRARQEGPDEVGPGRGARDLRDRPAQVPDFIALRGDPSDGLPGRQGHRRQDRGRPAAPQGRPRARDPRRDPREAVGAPCADRAGRRAAHVPGHRDAAHRAARAPARRADRLRRRASGRGGARAWAGWPSGSPGAELSVDRSVRLAAWLARASRSYAVSPTQCAAPTTIVDVDRVAQALGGALGARPVGRRQQREQLVGLPADDHVGVAQARGEQRRDRVGRAERHADPHEREVAPVAHAFGDQAVEQQAARRQGREARSAGSRRDTTSSGAVFASSAGTVRRRCVLEPASGAPARADRLQPVARSPRGAGVAIGSAILTETIANAASAPESCCGRRAATPRPIRIASRGPSVTTSSPSLDLELAVDDEVDLLDRLVAVPERRVLARRDVRRAGREHAHVEGELLGTHGARVAEERARRRRRCSRARQPPA